MTLQSRKSPHSLAGKKTGRIAGLLRGLTWRKPADASVLDSGTDANDFGVICFDELVLVLTNQKTLRFSLAEGQHCPPLESTLRILSLGLRWASLSNGGVIMVCTMLMCCALLGADGSQSGKPSAAADLSGYEAARSQLGRDPNAHVRLALWCESHGLQSERTKHLALAVLYDPSHALARGLLGMVSYQGKWGRPEVVGPQVQNDRAYRDAIREYLDRRPRTADKVDAQLKLAAWCEQKGLKCKLRPTMSR